MRFSDVFVHMEKEELLIELEKLYKENESLKKENECLKREKQAVEEELKVCSDVQNETLFELEQTEIRLAECERKEGLLKSKLVFAQQRCALLNERIKIYETDNAFLTSHIKASFNDCFKKIFEKVDRTIQDNQTCSYLNSNRGSAVDKRRRKTWSNIWVPSSISSSLDDNSDNDEKDDNNDNDEKEDNYDNDEKEDLEYETDFDKISTDEHLKDLEDFVKKESSKVLIDSSIKFHDDQPEESSKITHIDKRKICDRSIDQNQAFTDVQFLEDERIQDDEQSLIQNPNVCNYCSCEDVFKKSCKKQDLLPALHKNNEKWFPNLFARFKGAEINT